MELVFNSLHNFTRGPRHLHGKIISRLSFHLQDNMNKPWQNLDEIG